MNQESRTYHTRSKLQKYQGFSTTEFLIVIAVLAVLSFFVIPYLYSIKNLGTLSLNGIESSISSSTTPAPILYPGSDAKVQSDLDAVQPSALLDFNAQTPKSYGSLVSFTQYTKPFSGAGITGAQGVTPFGDGLFGDIVVAKSINDAAKWGGPIFYATNGTSYFIAERQQEGTYWCVDSSSIPKAESEMPTAAGDGTTFSCSQP